MEKKLKSLLEGIWEDEVDIEDFFEKGFDLEMLKQLNGSIESVFYKIGKSEDEIAKLRDKFIRMEKEDKGKSKINYRKIIRMLEDMEEEMRRKSFELKDIIDEEIPLELKRLWH